MAPARRALGILSSLKLAVFVILALSASLAAGTILESKFDAASAQYWVYRAAWFHAILGLLGINIIAVMVSRWPWKKRHLPFLAAHVGIITLLFGAWLTDRYGLDGMLRVGEGDSSGVVELTDAYLTVTDLSKSNDAPGAVQRIRIKWQPPGVDFLPLPLDSFGLPLIVDDYLARADAEVKFDAPEAGAPANPNPQPWISLKTQGGPMPFSQTFKLWSGDATWSRIQAGPALIVLIPKKRAAVEGIDSVPQGRPVLELAFDEKELRFRARSTAGKLREGAIPLAKLTGVEAASAEPVLIDPGWTMGIRFQVSGFLPDAKARIEYQPARMAFGPQAPSLSAVRIRTRADSRGVWVGLGDRAQLTDGERRFDVGYFPARVVLPFSIRLDHFKIDRYQGTANPSEYSSQVTVLDEGPGSAPGGKSTVISMNEPLEHRGTTVYQASYEEGSPRPTVSLFSINRDPGRIWKYAGSLILVLGCVLLFASRRQKKPNSNLKEGGV